VIFGPPQRLIQRVPGAVSRGREADLTSVCYRLMISSCVLTTLFQLHGLVRRLGRWL